MLNKHNSAKNGGDMASTWVAKPSVHVEHCRLTLKSSCKSYSCKRR